MRHRNPFASPAQERREKAAVQGRLAHVQGQLAQARREKAVVQGQLAQAVQDQLVPPAALEAVVQGQVAHVQGQLAQVRGENAAMAARLTLLDQWAMMAVDV